MAEERDPRLQSAYRALGAEEPPRKLDEAILAASRRAVESHPAPLVAPTSRRAWFVPLAAAAVLVLAVSLTLHLQFEQAGEERVPAPAQQPKEAAPEQPRPAPSPPPEREQAPRVARTEARAPVLVEPAAPKSVQQREPAPFAADVTMQRSAREAARESQAAGRAASVAASARAAATAETPEKELERIARLRSEGRHEEADKALAEFRKRYPDFSIPAPMLERVERR